jgi:hypothetical protein
MATTTKFNNIQNYMIEEEGFYLAKVTMYRQDSWTREKTDVVDTYEGLIKETDSGIIWMIRPQANMRSRFKSTILTVSERLISVEKVVA